MTKIKLGSVLIEQKKSVKSPDGKNLDLIGVSNEIGLHVSRAKRIDDLSRYKFIEMGWFAYNPMRVNVGSVGYVYKQDQIGIVSPDYVVFSCSDEILPEYLLYLLQSDEGIEAINKNASGAVRKRLYFSDLARIEIVLPSIESQKNRLKVFRRIKELGNQISEQTSKGNILAQLKQSILQEVIQGKLTEEWREQNPDVEPASELLKRITAEKAQLVKDKKIKKGKTLPPITEEEIPFELPDGWAWCRFMEIVDFQIGKTPASKQLSFWSNGSISWLNIKDMVSDGFVTKTSKKITEKAVNEVFKTQKIVPENTLLMSFKLTVGKVSINKIPLYHNEAIISIFPFTGISKEFLFKVLPVISELSASKKVLMGQTFNSSSLSAMLFPLPPHKEQKAIVAKAETLMDKCQALEREIKTSEANAQMLMQVVLKEAFEGEKKTATV
ncbi:restriction endonuclease subunit S [Aquimarina sp. LLG6339-5]|uniref:restriction endonuclease subunit S n=1 Tax=Aquimarina sp. LLG6339-5 TaxID=3160830 RepID=UPI0038695966